MREDRAGKGPLIGQSFVYLERTATVAPISTAVTHTSPSPCAKSASPVENDAPLAKTGSNSFAPLVSCLTSKFPPFSRGGSVRSPSRPQRPPGTAPAASGGKTMPPFSSARCSRSAHSLSFCPDGAVAEMPMKGAPGMRTPGISAAVAQPSRIFQWATNGCRHDVAEKTQARNDGAERGRLRHDVEKLDLDHVARLSTLDEDRSSQGVDASGISFARSATLLSGATCPSTASRVSRMTSSPSATSAKA